MKKLNVGAGYMWFEDGWETLDNSPLRSIKKESFQHYGKCWDSKLENFSYDILFTSHMLEHVPHFRLEKTISEFNRLLKINGTLRIAVPSLEKAAKAYIKKDHNFFKKSIHYSDHMGIGASFLRVMISPGSQNLVFSREMDEILGGYAHLYSFDFLMLKKLLEKWGFSNVKESEPGKSSIKEMQQLQYAVVDKKKYLMDYNFLRKKSKMNSNIKIKFGGFDKKSNSQLIVEATKLKNVKYKYDLEYNFNKISRFDSIEFKIKIAIFRVISKAIDFIFFLLIKMRINKLIKFFLKIKN